MMDVSNRSFEKLRIAAEITRTLAAQMAELRELREAVKRAEGRDGAQIASKLRCGHL
jgi:hypothetical protein